MLKQKIFKPLSFSVTVYIILFGSNNVACANESSFGTNGGHYYIEGGVNYYRNASAGKLSHSPNRLVPSAPTILISYDNHTSDTKRPGFYIGGGYSWKPSYLHSWRIGARFSRFTLAEKGLYVVGSPNLYRYDINTLLANVILRFSLHYSAHHVLYLEGNTGLAHLASHDFGFLQKHLTMSRKKKSINNFDYGLTFGWGYLINQHLGIDLSIGYQDLGSSSLGVEVVQRGARSKGNLKQRLYGVMAKAGLSYQF